VYGSSPSDRGAGAAAAKKLLASWGKLAMEVAYTKDKHDQFMYEPLETTFGDATIAFAQVRLKLTGKKKWVLVSAFAIAKQTPSGPQIVALAYGAD